MVAPHQVGNLARAFVRVPNSGSGRTAKSIFCDLSKVSNLAATISVPQNLPPATNVLAQSPPMPIKQKRPRSDETEDSAPKAKIQHAEAPPTGAPVKTLPVTLMTMRIPNLDIKKLKEENERLRKEYETLKKQISLFKQLIRNPQRLNSVLCRLKEKSKKA